MRIAITGGTGFIGSVVSRMLIKRGHEVIYLGRSRCSNKKNQFIQFNLDNSNNFQHECLIGVDVVIHIAACVHKKHDNVDVYMRQNVEATGVLFSACKKAQVKKFIFFSTVGVYGLNKASDMLTILSKESPNTPYAHSKLLAEKLLLSDTNTNLSTSVLRLPLVLGEDAPGNLMLLAKIARKIRFLPFGSLCNKRSILRASTLTKIIVTMCEDLSRFNGLQILCDHEPISTGALSNEVLCINRIKGLVIKVPSYLLKFTCRIFLNRKTYDQLFGDLVFKSTIDTSAFQVINE